jgi:hypothetical protein
MLGEMTPAMVEAIVQSPAHKVVMPLKSAGVEIVGLKNDPIPHLMDELARRVAEIVRKTKDV